MSLQGEHAAEALLARLKKCKTSPTHLFWLHARSSMLASTEIGAALLELCRIMDVQLPLNRAFFGHVHKAAADLIPVTPEFFVVDSLKDAAINKFRQKLHRMRCMEGEGDPFAFMCGMRPFCFQCLAPKTEGKNAFSGSLFFIFANPEDGLRKIVEILKNQGYEHEGKMHPFSQVYEHRLAVKMLGTDEEAKCVRDNCMAYILLDWEVEEERFGGRLTRDQIRDLASGFPEWFYMKLVEKRFVDLDTVVTGESRVYPCFISFFQSFVFAAVVVKDKSRPLANDNYKHSLHVVVEVVGVPALDLKSMCTSVFGQYRELLSQFRKDKNFDAVDDKTLLAAYWIGADIPTMGGNTGFAMMFSKKSPKDPSARLVKRAAYVRKRLCEVAGGAKNPKPFEPVDAPHELSTLSEYDALWLLYSASCSIAKAYMANPSVVARDLAGAQQSRTAARHRAAPGVPGRAPGTPLGQRVSSLPDWLYSVLDQTGGYTLRSESANAYLQQVMRLVTKEHEEGQWAAYHIDRGAMPCVLQLSEDPPVRHHHTNNGGVVALWKPKQGETEMYARCTQCYASKKQNEYVQVVRNSEGKHSPWIILNKSSFYTMLDEAGVFTVVDYLVYRIILYYVFEFSSIFVVSYQLFVSVCIRQEYTVYSLQAHSGRHF